jgi:aspartate aminotransferase
MPNAGYPDVRKALAKKASKDHQCTVPPSHIIMTAGAAGGLNVVFKTILNPGDEVIVPKPYFVEYRVYVKNHGGNLLEAATMPDFSPDLKEIEKLLSHKTAAVLINSPNNPTGKVYLEQDIAALAALLRRHGTKTGRFPYLVADEPYREIVYDGIAVASVLSAYEESVIVTSFSKSLSLPGERIGYIAAGPETGEKEDLLNGLIYSNRVLGFVNAPALMQRITAELQNEKAAIAIYDNRRKAFKEVLDDAGLQYAQPEGAFYFFVKVPEQKPGGKIIADDNAFCECLKKHLVLGVPGSGFACPGWLRFAYCVNEKTIRASSAAFKDAVNEWLS